MDFEKDQQDREVSMSASQVSDQAPNSGADEERPQTPDKAVAVPMVSQVAVIKGATTDTKTQLPGFVPTEETAASPERMDHDDIAIAYDKLKDTSQAPSMRHLREARNENESYRSQELASDEFLKKFEGNFR